MYLLSNEKGNLFCTSIFILNLVKTTMTLGTKIKHYRNANRLTQKQVADALSITKNSITAWEKDRAAPSVLNLRSLVKVLNITIADLFEDEKTKADVTKTNVASHFIASKSPPFTNNVRIPIRGYAQGNYIDVGNAVKKPIGYLDLSSAFANIVDLYAVYVTGNSMSPVHNHGDTRLVSPHTPYKIGDTVVLARKATAVEPETSYIKIFDKTQTLDNGQTMLTFSDFNKNQTTMVVDQNNIQFVHKVMTYNEILGL